MILSIQRDVFRLMAPLFEYPDSSYHEHVARAAAASPDAALAEMTAFVQQITGCPLASLEESFIRLFDMNPDCALDIGWHLFGEDYARGEFLVKLKASHRQYGIVERFELPDHLPLVLRLVAEMTESEAAAFVREFLSPALLKIRSNVKQDGNPFIHLLNATAACLPENACIPSAGEAAHE